MASRKHSKRRKPPIPCKCNQEKPAACKIHDEMDDKELEFRKQAIISAIKEVMNAGDPYKVVSQYRLQAQNIDAAIRKRKDKSEKPPQTIIGLKTGKMHGKILPGGG